MVYAVGDIHGELGMLEELLGVLPLADGDSLVFLGDYIDRGPEPRRVVDRLIELGKRRSCIFLLGNHESMFCDFIGWRDAAYFGGDAFLMNGGDRTLASYGYFDLADPCPENFELAPDHEAFFRNLRLHYRVGDYLFVHAGLGRSQLDEVDTDYAMRKAAPEDLLWDRSTIDLPHKLGITLVYGHTPASDLSVRWNPPFSIGIDTGAVYGGRLSAVRLPDETLFQV